jgi:signal transduction histidine kinase
MMHLQVARNFTSNGIKFTPRNGVVTVTVKCSQHGGEGGSDAPLSEEEVILDSNEQARKAMKSLQLEPDILLPDVLNKEGKSGKVGDDSGSCDEKQSSFAKNEKEVEDTIVTSDGRNFQKYGRVIVSFQDTGAGISQVCSFVITCACTFT